MSDTATTYGSKLAAIQNLDESWHEVLSKYGLNVVVVVLQTQITSPIHQHPELWKALGLELMEVSAGKYDSSFYHKASVWHFFHCQKLGCAIGQLKRSLEKRGLLPIANILHAEAADELIQYWPPTAEKVTPIGE